MLIDPIKTYTYKDYMLYNENERYGMPDIYTFEDIVRVGIYDNLEIDFNSFDL